MKKLNNKGFAISTLIYGLAIMGIMIVAILMATMAQTRSNNNNLAKSIEEDLNRFSKTETSFKPIGNNISSQEYIVPESGWYKIDLWGTQGGDNGGKGAYTSGVIELQEGDVLYFYVGKQVSGKGGYASEVRMEGGAYTNSVSYETRIMSAAGGSLNANGGGGTLYGYKSKMIGKGGFIKSQGSDKDFSLLPIDAEGNNTNGTLVGYPTGYELSDVLYPPVNSAISASSASNEGGDGFIPSSSQSIGAASFIAGYSGGHGVSQGHLTTNTKVECYERSYSEEDGTGTNAYGELKGTYYFVDGIMLPRVHSGDGYAKIERVKPKTDSTIVLNKKNNKLNNVRYIRDCTDTPSPTWNKIVATYNGNTIEKVPTISGKCATADLGSVLSLDEIVVFHNPGIDYKNDNIQVSSNNSNWVDIKGLGNGTELSETETPTGYRVSAYQYDATGPLPAKGNYIIQPVLSENKVITASETAETNANPITIDYYNGEKRQKWSIELITDTTISPGYNPNDPSTYEYKIVELARYKALSITQDENLMFNTLSAIDKFNEHARNEPQIWKIKPVGNGTYTIETVVDPTKDTGYILPQTNSTVSDALNQLIIGKKNKDTARFKLIQIDYSSN